MKKTYIAPKMEAATLNETNIICASVIFGNGSTDVMYSDDRISGLDDIDLGF